MKTTIHIHENEEWVYYPANSNKIEHVNRTTAGECFFFDTVELSASSVIPQPATPEDPRAGQLSICLKFDADEFDWFWDKPSRIKGLKEWLKKISKADAKRYALEISELPRKEIEEKTIEFDAKEESLNQAEKEVVLQFMAAIITIQTVNPKIFVIGKNQKDDLIINVLKFLPKEYRKVKIAMPWSSGLDLGKISITDEDKLPVISNPMYVITETSDTVKSKFPDQFDVAKMFYDNPGLAKDLAVSDIPEAYSFYKEVGQEEFSAVYEYCKNYNKKADDENKIKIRLVQILNVEFNEFYKKYSHKDPQQIWELFQFLQDYPEYKDLGWDELFSLREFHRNPSVNAVDPKHIKSVYKLSKDIGVGESVEFYETYKDLIAEKDLKLEDILNKNFYDFHKAASKKGFKPDAILDLYIFCKEVPTDKKFEQSEILEPDFYEFLKDASQKGVKTDVVPDLYRFFKKVVQKDRSVKPHDILDYYDSYKDVVRSENLKWEDILDLDFYEFYKKVPENVRNSSVMILDLYNSYKGIVQSRNLKWESILNPDFYDFHREAVRKGFKPDAILNLYIFCKEVPKDKKFERSEILEPDFYEFLKAMVQNGFKTVVIPDLYRFYKKVLQKNSGLKPYDLLDYYNVYKDFEDVLNPDFYDFHKAASQKGFKPDVILDLYRFYSGISKDKKLELSEILNPDFDIFRKETVRKNADIKPDVVLELYRLHRDAGIKLQDVLDYYNSYKEIVRSSNLRWEVILNKNFYDFHKAASQKGFKPDVILDLYRFYKEIPTDKKLELSEILNQDFYEFRKEASSKGFKPDAILDLHRFYKKILQKEANIKPHDILDYYNFYKETVQAGNLKHGDVLNSRFYEFHEKVVVPADESSLKMENILSFYEFYRINCANQGQADVSPEQFDIWKSFYKFYAKVIRQADKNPKQSGILSKWWNENKNLKQKDVLNPHFYGFYEKVVKTEDNLELSDVSNFYEFYKNINDLNPLFFRFYVKLIPIVGKQLESSDISNFYECYYIKAVEHPDKAADVFKEVKDKKNPNLSEKIIKIWRELYPPQQKPDSEANIVVVEVNGKIVEAAESENGVMSEAEKTEAEKTEAGDIRHGENSKKQNRPTPLYVISLLYLFLFLSVGLLYVSSLDNDEGGKEQIIEDDSNENPDAFNSTGESDDSDDSQDDHDSTDSDKGSDDSQDDHDSTDSDKGSDDSQDDHDPADPGNDSDDHKSEKD